MSVFYLTISNSAWASSGKKNISLLSFLEQLLPKSNPSMMSKVRLNYKNSACKIKLNYVKQLKQFVTRKVLL